MNEEIKKEWVAALRSGEYKQGKGALCCEYPNEVTLYCCLGVLCDLAVKKSIGEWEELATIEEVKINVKGYKNGESRNHLILPKVIKEWALLEDSNPYINKKQLSRWNDTDCKTFVEIADMIEKNL